MDEKLDFLAIVNDARQHSPSALNRSIKETDITPDQMADVIIEAQKGDPASRAVLELAGRRVGTAIGSYLITVYNPFYGDVGIMKLSDQYRCLDEKIRFLHAVTIYTAKTF